jgi:hypothetical protein
MPAPSSKTSQLHIDTERLARAERGIWHAARVLERVRFSYLFRAGDGAPVLAALRAYRNADGGFGHAIEPDFRGPVSQPLGSDFALRVLSELGALDAELLADTLRYLRAITVADGGVPNVLPSALAFPRAPWWAPAGEQPPGSLLPTASIAGLLHAAAVRDPWLDRASSFCWGAIDALIARMATVRERIARIGAAYEARAALGFLEHVPDRLRAERSAAALGEALLSAGLITLAPDASAEASQPLDFASNSRSLACGWFDQAVIGQHLDALIEAQASDGGWDVPWAIWTPVTALEWRGILIVDRLKLLRAWDRVRD